MPREKRYLSLAVVIISVALTISSCGLSKEEKAYKESCGKLLANLTNMNKFPTTGNIDQFADAGYVSLVSGKENREKFKVAALSKFPFLSSVINKGEWPTSQPSQYTGISLQAWEMALVGTGFSLDMSETDRRYILDEKPEAYPKFAKFVNKVANEKACGRFENENIRASKKQNWDLKIKVQWSQAENMIQDIGSMFEAILACDSIGKFEGNKCSQVNYVSKNDDYSESKVCNSQKLSITEYSGEPGVSCGILSFTIFQADLDTGACQALGNWTDANGNSRIAIFAGCGFVENSSYKLAVRLGNNVTYTTRLGTDKTVVSFSLVN